MLPTGCRNGWIAGAALAIAACGSPPTSPDGASLPLAGETATMRYYHEPGDGVEVTRQDAFNEWAITRLGITPPRKVEYRRYLSRGAMGRYTGNANTNGFAEPELWRIHTIWAFDNHEVVHVYTAMIGRPSDFFNEGIAVCSDRSRRRRLRSPFQRRAGARGLPPGPDVRHPAVAAQPLRGHAGLPQHLRPGHLMTGPRILRWY